MFGASVWFYTQSSALSYLLYFPALTFGFSACAMMVTSQTMLLTSSNYPSLYLIGADDFTKTLNEVLHGFVVFVIMQAFPQGHHRWRNLWRTYNVTSCIVKLITRPFLRVVENTLWLTEQQQACGGQIYNQQRILENKTIASLILETWFFLSILLINFGCARTQPWHLSSVCHSSIPQLLSFLYILLVLLVLCILQPQPVFTRV